MTAPSQAPNPAAHRVAVPWTVRVAGWSARHRWPVFVLWFVVTIGIFLASLAAGGTDSAEAVSNDERSKYEAGKAYVVYNAANTQSAEEASQQFLLIVSSPDATIDDPAFAAAISDIVARVGALQSTVEGTTGPIFEQLVDPITAPASAGLVSPDRTTVRVVARVPGDGETLVARLEPVPALVAEIKAAHPGYRIHALNNTLANDEISELINGGLDASLRLTIPLTFVILLIAFGAVVAAVIPLVLAVSCAAGSVRDSRALQPVRLAGQPVREPAGRAHRAGGRGRLLAVHAHPLPNGAAAWPRQARRDPRREQHRRAGGVLLGPRRDDLDRRAVPARRSAVPVDGDRDDLGRPGGGDRLADVPAGDACDPRRRRESAEHPVRGSQPRRRKRILGDRRAEGHAAPDHRGRPSPRSSCSRSPRLSSGSTWARPTSPPSPTPSTASRRSTS